jgi:hypothetical protein
MVKAVTVSTGITAGAASATAVTSSLDREIRSPVPARSTWCCGSVMARLTSSSRSAARMEW